MAKGSRKKAGRARGWGPAYLLTWRAAHPSVRLMFQLQAWAEEWGTTVKSLLAEVRDWRSLAPYTFRGTTYESYEAAFLALDPAGQGRTEQQRGRGVEDPLWRERYLIAYREQGHNRKKAADVAGIPWATIRAKLQRGGVDFDSVLAALVEEEDSIVRELARSGNVRALELAAELAEGKDIKAVQFLGRHALDNLERLEPEQFGRFQRIEHSGAVGVHAQITIRNEAVAQALIVSQRAIVALPAPAEPSRIIEGELVEEIVR